MSKKDDQFIADARERFAEIQAAERDNRAAAIEDFDFDNGQQWDDAASKSRAGRPMLTINKVAGTNKQIIGDMRQNRPRIKVRPVDSGADVKTATLLTGLIRNIENNSDADGAYDYGGECAVRAGYGYWRVLTEYADDAAFEQDIKIKRIVNPFSVYYDQSAVEADYSDARFCFVSETISREEFNRKYPKHGIADWETGDGEADSAWFTSDSARIAEYWYKEPTTKDIFELADGRVIEVKKPQIIEQPEQPPQIVVDPQTGQPMQTPGQPAQTLVIGEGMDQPLPFKRTRKVKCDRVMWAKISGAEILEGPQEWAGKYIPIVFCGGEEVWLEGKRVLRSATRFARDPQKMYNWAVSNTVETLALAPKQPWVLTSKQIEGHEQQWKQSNTRPMPYLLYNSTGEQQPQRLGGSVPDSGAMQAAMQASDDIKATTGVFDASLGARGNETSGKAILARQRQGNQATFVFPDNQVRAVKYTGKILVDLIPKIYDTQRVVRLMGDDLRKQINPQQMPGTQVSEDGTSAWAVINVVGPDGKVVANDLSVGRYDVVIDAGPGYMTKRMEAADGLIQLTQAAPQFAPLLIPRVAQNLDWPEAQEIGDEIKKASQPQQAPPDPRIQLDMAKGQLDLQGKQLDLQGKKLDLAGKAQGMQREAQNHAMGIQDRAAEREAGEGDDQRTYKIAAQAALDVLRQVLGNRPR